MNANIQMTIWYLMGWQFSHDKYDVAYALKLAFNK